MGHPSGRVAGHRADGQADRGDGDRHRPPCRGPEVAALQRARAAEQEKLRTYVRGIALLAQDPTPEEAAEFAVVRAEFTARIRALDAELAAAVPAVNVAQMRALHERLTRTAVADLVDGFAAVADLVDGFAAVGDTEALRELAAGLIASATITERRPESHPVWARATVTWTPDVQRLLGAGLLRLAEPEPGPVLPTSAELHRARVRRYRQRQREQRLAAQAGTAAESQVL